MSNELIESRRFNNPRDGIAVGYTTVGDVPTSGPNYSTKIVHRAAGSKKKSNNSGNKPKRGQANKRERVRTENVNVGFDNLRKLIPTDPKDRKLSKIEVLRLATSYINHLYNLTKANSCLEAAALSEETDEDEEEGQNLDHVCTFCLMMNKSVVT